MALNLKEEKEELIFETSISQDNCDIINLYIRKEVNYWKDIVKSIGGEEFDGYQARAPKRRKLSPFSVSKMKTNSGSIDKVLKELKSKYRPNFQTESLRYISRCKNIDTLDEMVLLFKTVELEFSRVEVFQLRNGYYFGKWLLEANRLFRYERYVKKTPLLPATFEKWLKEFNISRKRADNYKRLSILVDKAQKLVNCSVSVNFIMKNYKALETYFENTDTPWRHVLNCSCEKCSDYFQN